MTDDNYMTLNDIARHLNVGLRTIQKYKAEDPNFPKTYRVGKRFVRFRRSDVMAWIETGA